MENSILNAIKLMLGLGTDYDAFDNDVIVSINSALNILCQYGVGPKDGFYITGSGETWSDYIDSRKDLEMVKQYVYLKTRLAFDPPTSSAVITSFEQMAKELEWRLSVQVDPSNEEDTTT